MKRSTQIGLGAAGLLLVAGTWSIVANQDDQLVYETVAACRADGQISADQCESRFEEAKARHVREAKRYPSTGACEADYGLGQCESWTVNGAAVAVPAFAGIMLARSLARGGGSAEPLLPPDRNTCPPGSQEPECRRSSSSSGSGGGGGSSGRRYSKTSGESVSTSGHSGSVHVASRGGFGSTGHSVGGSSS